MMRRVAILTAGLMLLGAANSFAQMNSWEDRVFANISWGITTESSKDISPANVSFTLYDETATVGYATKHVVKTGGNLTDVTVGARVWNRYNVGVAVSFFGHESSADASVTASIPHPVFFDRPRSVTNTVTGLAHKESWAGILAVYDLPVTDKIDVMLLVGPAVVNVDQEISNFVTPSTEGVSGPQIAMTRETVSKKVWGFQFGVDGRFMVHKWVGAGLFLRVSKATANLNQSVSLDLGGFQAGAGLRFRF